MKREMIIGGLFLVALLVLLTVITYMGNQTIQSPSSGNPNIDSLPTGALVTPAPSVLIIPQESQIAEATTTPDDIASLPNVQSATDNQFWIAGYVTGEDGKSLSGGKIEIHVVDGVDPSIQMDEEGMNSGQSVTDEKGYYTIALSGPHEYQVRSIPPEGYLTLVERVTLTQDKPTLAKHFVHPLAPYSVRGKVIDSQTKASIAGARVALIRQGRDSHPQQTIETAKSATDGTFVISRIAKGTFRLESRADGYVDFTPYKIPGSPLLNIAVSEKTQNKEYLIEMDPGSSAIFHVVNAQGKPVEKAAIKITGDQTEYDYIGHSYTDSNGMAANKSLPQRQLYAEASHESEGKGFSQPFEPGSPDNPTRVEISLQGSASVSGKVVDSEGRPVSGRQVVAEIQSVESWKFPPSERVSPGEQGAYRIANLAPGSYRVFLTKKNTYPPSAMQTVSLELKAGEHRTGVDFILDKEDLTEIKGIVLDEENSEPVEGVYVHAVVYEKGNILGSEGTKTDAKGEFVIQGAPKGGDHIQFSMQDKEGYAHTISDRPANESYYTLKIKKSGQIGGKVIDPNNQPIAGANVYPIRYLNRQPNPMPYQTKVTGDDGTFSFSNLDPMDYSFRANADGYTQTDSEVIVLKKGESVDSVVIRMQKGYEIAGVVIDPQGAPLPNAIVSLYSYISNTNRSTWSNHLSPQEFPENARTDGEGKFVISEFPLNGDTLVIRHEKLAPMIFVVTPDMFAQQPYTIRMTPGGAIAGTVYGSDGKGISDVTVMTQNFPENLFRYETLTDKNGEYRFDSLMPASYMVLNNGAPEEPSGRLNAVGVVVVGGGGSGIDKQQYKNVRVEEGKTTRCDFGGGEGAVIRGTVFKRGQVVPAARLGLEYRNPEPNQIGHFLKTTSNGQGAYAFQAVTPGEYTITVSTEAGRSIDVSNCEYYTRVSVMENQPEYVVDLYIASLEIQGVVLDEESGEPISNAYIQPRFRSNTTRPRGVESLSTQSKADGTFSLLPQESGQYTFIAVNDGYATREFNVSVPSFQPGETLPPVRVEVRMKKDEMALIVHLFYEGQTASTSWAHFYGQTAEFKQRFENTPMPEPGVYRVIGLPEGEVDVSVTTYCNAKVMQSLPQKVMMQPGEITEISINIFETRDYFVRLLPPDDVVLQGDALLEILDKPGFIPQRISIRNIPERGIRNSVSIMIPSDSQRVRLTVPGYQPLEFVPESLVRQPQGDGEQIIELPIKPL